MQNNFVEDPSFCMLHACGEAACNRPLMKTGSVFMFYCACWGSTLLERVFPRLMRRFTLQTGFAILAMLVVSFVAPQTAAAQDAQPDDAPSQAVSATSQDTGAPAQNTNTDAPPASAPAATEPKSGDMLTLFPH